MASVTLARLTEGTFDINVRSQNGTTGAYEVDAFLAGDANGDFRVDDQDRALIRQARGSTVGDSHYALDADVNRNGRIGLGDLRLAKANLGAATKIRDLAIELELDAGSESGQEDAGPIDPIDAAPVSLFGRTVPGREVQLDADGDGQFDDATTMSDVAGLYQFNWQFEPEPKAFSVRVRDGFGQMATATQSFSPVNGSPIESFFTDPVWDGGGADNNWSTPANWAGDVVPGPTDIASFDATSIKPVVIDVNVNVASINIKSAYTGTITQGAGKSVTVGAGNYIQAGGTFVGSSGALDINGSVQLTAGTMVAPSGLFTVSGNWTRTGATFQAGSNTLTFDGSGTQTASFGPAQTLGTVSVNKTGGSLTFSKFGFTADTLSVSSGDTVKFEATKTFTVTNLALIGVAASPITLDSTEPWTSWQLNVSAAGTQTISFVKVKQSDAGSGAMITATTGGTNLGFNTNWDFGTAPLLVYSTAEAANLARTYVRFGEAMDTATATNPANYTLSGGLSVTTASISSDKKLVALTASGNLAIGSTTVTASSAIKSLVGRNLPTTTKTIVAGNSNGIPDSVGAVQLSLSTDGNQSVILNRGQQFTLTVTAPGTTARTIGIGQIREPGGTSVVTMGTSGTKTSATVTTAGGTNNTATVILRGGTTGNFQSDFTLRTYGSGELGVKSSTVIDLQFDNPHVYSLGTPQTFPLEITTTPAIANLELVSQTVVRAQNQPGFQPTSVTTLMADPQPARTAANGKTSVLRRTYGADSLGETFYLVTTNNPNDNIFRSGISTKRSEPVPTRPPGDVRVGPTPGTYDGRNQCPCRAGQDGSLGAMLGLGGGYVSASVDPSAGEKYLDARDLIIPGRGMDYEFRRVYHSFDYLAAFDSLRSADFGENWTFSYSDERLIQDGPNPDTAVIINLRAGQSANVFVNTASGKWVGASHEVFVGLQKNPNTGDFEIREESGLVRIYHSFTDPNLPGRLKEVRDRNDNRMTFHYERIDPNVAVTGDEKFVLAFVIDTLGREIRYQYYSNSPTPQIVGGRTLTVTSSNPGALGRLARVIDFKGDMNFDGNPESRDFPNQVNNRTLAFDYDADGNIERQLDLPVDDN